MAIGRASPEARVNEALNGLIDSGDRSPLLGRQGSSEAEEQNVMEQLFESRRHPVVVEII